MKLHWTQESGEHDFLGEQICLPRELKTEKVPIYAGAVRRQRTSECSREKREKNDKC